MIVIEVRDGELLGEIEQSARELGISASWTRRSSL
jgi:hypothetical protein